MDDLQKTEISVIVPVYRVERYIARCAGSLFGQTLARGVEFIFVDDATPDRSIEIAQELLQQFPHRQGQVRFLRHRQNRGLPAARNSGLAVARGAFVYHCDSDDYLEPDALRLMLGEAKRSNADMVWCDWYLSFEKNERRMREPRCGSPGEAVRKMLRGAMRFCVWNKLVRRRLYTENGIEFPAGHSIGEDMTMIRLTAAARRVAGLGEALYHYEQTNAGALTRKMSGAHFGDLSFNIGVTEAFLKRGGFEGLDVEIALLRLHTKLPLLMSNRKEDYQAWRSLYPESSRFAAKNPTLPFYLKILQWMAWKGQWWYVKFYYRTVIRLVYGVVYR